MRAWDRHILPVAKLVCIKFNLPAAMLAETDNEMRLDDWRLLAGLRVSPRINITNVTIKINQMSRGPAPLLGPTMPRFPVRS